MKRRNRPLEHQAVRRGPGKAKLGFGATKRELQRPDTRLLVAFLCGQLPPRRPGPLGFALLELDVFALETSRHSLSSLC